MAESVIVSVEFSHGRDKGILLVGKQQDGAVQIVNAFQGKEAEELWDKLITQTTLTNTKGRAND